MDEYEKNEKFREACYLGDIDLVGKFYHEQKPDLNSRNKVNGWTPLHWASKRNNVKLVEFLLSKGALFDIKNNDGKTPGQYAKDPLIASLLNTTGVPNETNKQDDNKFVPNFVKNPYFHYANGAFYSSSQLDSNPSSKPTEFIEQKPIVNGINLKNDLNRLITIKVRDSDEFDFVEVDLDVEQTSFEQFKEIVLKELEYDCQQMNFLKIRKLPNVLIRNSRDIKRLKEQQEIEVVFSKMK